MRHIVLHLLQPVSETTIGGADMHVLDLSQSEQYKYQYESIVCLRKNNKYLRRQFCSQGIYCICGDDSNILCYVMWLNRMLRDKDISIIHAHGYGANYQMLLLKCFFPSRWMKIPTVITCHGWIETSLRLKMMTQLDLFCHKFAQARIVCSKNNLSRVAGYKNAFYVPNGIVPFPARPFKHHSKIIIGFVGRLSWEKRPDKVLEVARILKPEFGEKIEFHIIGEGEMLTDLQNTTKNEQLQDLVIYEGQKTRDDIFSTIDILLLTSDSESTPRVVIEALYSKIPVVATNVGGVPELVLHNSNGFLVDKDDYMGMALALRTLIESPVLRQSFGELGHQYICKHFTAEHMASNVSQIYEKLLT